MDSARDTDAPTAMELLAIDIDTRMYVVLLEASAHDGWDAQFAALLRLAYGAGYYEALTESCRGQLCSDHGFAVPPAPAKPKGDEKR